jgi:hypothetical protein
MNASQCTTGRTHGCHGRALSSGFCSKNHLAASDLGFFVSSRPSGTLSRAVSFHRMSARRAM